MLHEQDVAVVCCEFSNWIKKFQKLVLRFRRLESRKQQTFKLSNELIVWHSPFGPEIKMKC